MIESGGGNDLAGKVRLSEYEKRLLADFTDKRPRYFSLVNAVIGAIGVACLLAFAPEHYLAIIVATLCGVLIGIYFEQKHIARLKEIIKKLF